MSIFSTTIHPESVVCDIRKFDGASISLHAEPQLLCPQQGHYYWVDSTLQNVTLAGPPSAYTYAIHFLCLRTYHTTTKVSLYYEHMTDFELENVVLTNDNDDNAVLDTCETIQKNPSKSNSIVLGVRTCINCLTATVKMDTLSEL